MKPIQRTWICEFIKFGDRPEAELTDVFVIKKFIETFKERQPYGISYVYDFGIVNGDGDYITESCEERVLHYIKLDDHEYSLVKITFPKDNPSDNVMYYVSREFKRWEYIYDLIEDGPNSNTFHARGHDEFLPYVIGD